MVELQGSLTVGVVGAEGAEEAAAEQARDCLLNGRTLGRFTLEQGVPVLEIGAHRLEGKVVKLKKPLAVIRRVEKDEDVSSSDYEDDSDFDAEYEIVATVRSKVLFKTRPKPLVGKRARYTF